jgi:hypothetical protein
MRRGSPAAWRLSFMEGRQEGLEPLDRAYDLSSLSGEVEAVGGGDRSMQQCRHESCARKGRPIVPLRRKAATRHGDHDKREGDPEPNGR